MHGLRRCLPADRRGDAGRRGIEGRRETVAWWQLSPPGFPDLWIEVRADIAGLQRERQDFFDEIVAMLGTVQFEQP